MHTAICTFEDRARAEEAVARLLRSGFDRADIHMEMRHPDGSPMHGDAAGPGPGAGAESASGAYAAGNRLAHFFSNLFGHDTGQDHATRYAGAMERGLCVVFVDAPTDAEGERAQQVLHGMEAGDVSLVQRAGQRPLREIVGGQAGSVEQRFGTAREDMGAEHNRSDERETLFPPERAMASHGWGEQRTLEVAEPPRVGSDLEPPSAPLRSNERDKPDR